LKKQVHAKALVTQRKTIELFFASLRLGVNRLLSGY